MLLCIEVVRSSRSSALAMASYYRHASACGLLSRLLMFFGRGVVFWQHTDGLARRFLAEYLFVTTYWHSYAVDSTGSAKH